MFCCVERLPVTQQTEEASYVMREETASIESGLFRKILVRFSTRFRINNNLLKTAVYKVTVSILTLVIIFYIDCHYII